MNNWNWQHALEYHEKTKHIYEPVRSGSHFLDWENKPHPFKEYKNAPSVLLSRELSLPEKGFFQSVLEKKGLFPPREVNLELVSSLLFFTAGITRVISTSHPPYKHYFRAAPGTGALHPTEIYVVTSKLQDLDAGAYHFDPLEFKLSLLRDGDWRSLLRKATSDDSLETASLMLIFTCLGWKNAWKYRERSYRHWFWDTGVMLTNLLTVASSFNLATKIILGFQDDLVNDLLGLDGKKEAAIVIVPINLGSITPNNEHLQLMEPIPDLTVKSLPLSKKEQEFKEIHEAYQQSRLLNSEDIVTWKEKVSQLEELMAKRTPPTSSAQSLDLSPLIDEMKSHLREIPTWKVILKRGSARKFTHRPITLKELAVLLYLGTSTELHADFIPSPKDESETSILSLNEWYLIINAVEGLEQGAYYYHPTSKTLYLLKKGRFRELCGHLCLGQALGSDASVAFFLLTPLKDVLKILGNRGYRAVQLEAGIRVEKAWLGAYAMGFGATGLTFYDDEIIDFFLPRSKDMEPTMVLTVGHPPYRTPMGKILPQLRPIR